MNTRFVCGTVSYRQQSLERALEGVAKSGFRAIEVACISGYCDHIYPEQMSVGDMDRLAKLVERFGLRIASIAGHIDLAWPLMGKACRRGSISATGERRGHRARRLRAVAEPD